MTDYVLRRDTVEIEILGIQTDIGQACLDQVCFKDELDRRYSGRHSGNNGYTRPEIYLRTMVPWLCASDDSQKSGYIDIDPYYGLGSSGRRNPPPSDPEKVMRDLNDVPSHHKERSRYLKIGALLLFLAIEGKNRVELFREHSKDIWADVTTVKVPEVIKVVPVGSGEKWAAIYRDHYPGGVLEGFAIPYPELAMPIYRACGAEISTTPIKGARVEAYWDDSLSCALSFLEHG